MASIKENLKKAHVSSLSGRGKLSVRFRNMNILLFLISFSITSLIMSIAFVSVISKLSTDYAGRYAVSAAEALSAHMSKQIGLISSVAHSNTVFEWLADEYDETKKTIAFDDMAGIVGDLYSFNLYITLESSRNEYMVGSDSSAEYVAALDESRAVDAWYFDCINSEREYILSIDIDHVLQRKRVWLDYKVVRNGVPFGVISTGLEFSHIAGELFAHNDKNTRSLIIDNNGEIQMDSNLMSDKEFLYSYYDIPFEKEFPYSSFRNAIDSYISGVDDYFNEFGELEVIKLSSAPYRYMTISPIKDTNWSVVILSSRLSLFDMSYFIPVSITVLALLIAFAIATSAANYRLIFQPLGKLDQSLLTLNNNYDEEIYGTDRNDELGHLSNTIKDLFHKANFDALTGIYNRRFMESNLVHILQLLSRSNDWLSVLMLDIDHFKKFNDMYGHDQGDICLHDVASSLSHSLSRSGDFAARYGGEEFIAVLPNTDKTGALLIADKILANVRSLGIPHPRNTAAPYVTISIGVTSGQISVIRRWEEYVKRADEALYESKKNGRNQYTFLEFNNH